MTTRSALRLLQVARTIADLNGKETVCADAVAEAGYAAPTHWSERHRWDQPRSVSREPVSRAPCTRDIAGLRADRRRREMTVIEDPRAWVMASPNQSEPVDNLGLHERLLRLFSVWEH